MNYTEWVLEEGEKLWREWEKVLGERLALLPRGKEKVNGAQKERERETGEEERALKSEAGMTAEEGREENTAAEEMTYLARKLGLLEEYAENKADEGGIAAFTAQKTARGTSGTFESEARGGAEWMRESLAAAGTDGAAAAAAREKTVFALSQEREVRETESFSLSLERDARRYDGGFLYY